MLKHKKLLSALLAAVMLFTVTGCGGTGDSPWRLAGRIVSGAWVPAR